MEVKKSKKDIIHALTPYAARTVELLFLKLPELKATTRISLIRSGRKEEKAELELFCKSPSGKIEIFLETSTEHITLRFSESGKAGFASAIFFMHRVNFHRTSEEAVNFIEKIALGQMILARTKQRVFPLFGHKRLKFFEIGEIVGQTAAQIEKVMLWKSLKVKSTAEDVI